MGCERLRHHSLKQWKRAGVLVLAVLVGKTAFDERGRAVHELRL